MEYRMLRNILLGAFAVLLALGAGACGNEDSTPPSADTAASTTLVSTDEVEEKLGLHTTEAVGAKQYVVILADFPDVERRFSEETMSERLIDFLSGYYYEASYHKLTLDGVMTGRYTLPRPVSQYRIAPHNMSVDRDKVRLLVRDVANAADDDIEFSEDLYVIIVLGATPAEYGMIGLCAVPGMLGFTSSAPIRTTSGETISNAVIFCENAHLGTHLHDTLHMLGGAIDGRRATPCLYDHILQAQWQRGDRWDSFLVYMGYWDPLSSHMPYDWDLPPTGLSSWTKLRLGWIDPAKIALVRPGETATIRLDPLVSDEASTHVIRIPITEDTYYLIENRQPIESDENLPSSGILVLFADDNVYECRGSSPVRIVDANPTVPVFLDAAFDVDKTDRYIDRENNLAIVLLRKDGMSYDILITTPDQVAD